MFFKIIIDNEHYFMLFCKKIKGGLKMVNLAELIKIAMIKKNVNQTKLAELSGQAKNNLSNKMVRNDFKLSEYEKLVNALGCKLIIEIELPNGERIK